ncbi:MAG: ribosome maturation factor RimM [Desulfotignum sp.]|nr:ribosome maturation factor RimM [Desulfotignum sp.]
MSNTVSSDTGPDDLPDPDDLLVMGKITGVHGLDGKVKVRSFAESSDIYALKSRVFLRTENKTDARPYVIEKCIDRKKDILMRLSGVDTRESADDLVGKEILLDRQQLADPEDDVWYWQDLFGLKVVDQNRGDLGTIETIIPTGAHDVLVVKNNDKEVLVPMHRKFVTQVDLEKKTVTTCLPREYE